MQNANTGLVKGTDLDFLNPNTWDLSPRDRFIYGDDKAAPEHIAIVDEVDYDWAMQWRWCPIYMRNRHDPTTFHVYLRRAVGENHGGQRLRTYTLHLHREILWRAQPNQPTPKHKYADHRDGNQMNCRRSNLRWLTQSQNTRNRHGRHPQDFGD